MNKSRILFMVLAAAFSAGHARAEIKTEAIDYRANGTVLKGYLAYDDAIGGKRPGVLVVHEWWGHNDHARRRARMLAQLGYTALAVDMYGDGKTAAHPKEAGQFSGEIRRNMPVARKRFQAAMDVLRRHKTTDPDRIAAIGYCFGGGLLLQMVRDGLDLDAVVSFHGGLGTSSPAVKGRVKARILVLHGAEDKFVTPEQIIAFKKEMENAGVDYRFVSYPGATHSFTNPKADEYRKKFDIPVGYNAAADRKSWAEMKRFLRDTFGR